jgi:hypothetical protein
MSSASSRTARKRSNNDRGRAFSLRRRRCLCRLLISVLLVLFLWGATLCGLVRAVSVQSDDRRDSSSREDDGAHFGNHHDNSNGRHEQQKTTTTKTSGARKKQQPQFARGFEGDGQQQQQQQPKWGVLHDGERSNVNATNKFELVRFPCTSRFAYCVLCRVADAAVTLRSVRCSFCFRGWCIAVVAFVGATQSDETRFLCFRYGISFRILLFIAPY